MVEKLVMNIWGVYGVVIWRSKKSVIAYIVKTFETILSLMLCS